MFYVVVWMPIEFSHILHSHVSSRRATTWLLPSHETTLKTYHMSYLRTHMITTTKLSTTKPYPYFIGHNVSQTEYLFCWPILPTKLESLDIYLGLMCKHSHWRIMIDYRLNYLMEAMHLHCCEHWDIWSSLSDINRRPICNLNLPNGEWGIVSSQDVVKL